MRRGLRVAHAVCRSLGDVAAIGVDLGTKTDLGTQLQRKSSQIANFCFPRATNQKPLECRTFGPVREVWSQD